jgi:hypothetical protein
LINQLLPQPHTNPFEYNRYYSSMASELQSIYSYGVDLISILQSS